MLPKENWLLETGLRLARGAFTLEVGSARGGMADAPDLGSGSERIGGSSPLARTMFFHSF